MQNRTFAEEGEIMTHLILTAAVFNYRRPVDTATAFRAMTTRRTPRIASIQSQTAGTLNVQDRPGIIDEFKTDHIRY